MIGRSDRRGDVVGEERTVEHESATSLGERRDEIGTRRATLERRLDDGYRRIEAALGGGADVAAWEEFWLRLLTEYESVCDEAQAA